MTMTKQQQIEDIETRLATLKAEIKEEEDSKEWPQGNDQVWWTQSCGKITKPRAYNSFPRPQHLLDQGNIHPTKEAAERARARRILLTKMRKAAKDSCKGCTKTSLLYYLYYSCDRQVWVTSSNRRVKYPGVIYFGDAGIVEKFGQDNQDDLHLLLAG